MLSHVLAPMLARRGIHYGWAMVAVTFLAMLSTAAAMGRPGVRRGPCAAALRARYGTRAGGGGATACIVAGIGLATRMTAPWQLWATWGLLVGFGTGLTAMVLEAAVASRWFSARRGLVLGLLTASAATGSLVFLPAAAWLAQHHGWRVALLPAAAACAVSGLLVLLVARDDPADLGLAAFGAGWSRDALATYLPAFFAAGTLCLLAALAALAIGRRPDEAVPGDPVAA